MSTAEYSTKGMPERIIDSPQPSIGLVIGTYGSPCYIHLGLEAARRNCGNIPILVHDDCSEQAGAVEQICRQYDAEFSCNQKSLGHIAGDYSVFLSGFRWAGKRKIDILAKFSRRWIPLIDWVSELQILSYVTQYATYNSIDTAHALGFRTECVAFHTVSWLKYHIIARMAIALARNHGGHFVEGEIHSFAKEVHQQSCPFNRLYELAHPDRHGLDIGYGEWRLLGRSRCERQSYVLWRNTHVPAEYLEAAHDYGIRDYTLSDFTNIKEH